MRVIHFLLPQPLITLAILGLWLALAPTFSLGQLVLGAFFGLTIAWATHTFWPDRPRLVRPLAGLALFVRIVIDIAIANWQVARLVVGPLDRLDPAFIEIPLDIDDPFVATLLGSIVSLTPGTVSVEIERQRKVLLVHALDADDPHGMVANIKARYEAPLKEIFRC
jgi:multicomponent K+:H+ antiporter subunit E